MGILCFYPAIGLFEWISCGLASQVPQEGEPTLSEQRERTNPHAAQHLRRGPTAALGG